MRYLFSCSVFVVGVVLILLALNSIWGLDEIIGVRPLVLLPNVEKALEIRVEQSGNLTQLSLVALGALVTLFLAKPQEAGLQSLRDAWPEYLMALIACLLMVTSYLCCLNT
jgi:hypothetical protein